MRSPTSSLRPLAALLALAGIAAPAAAVDHVWVGGNGGDWATAAHWTPAGVPGASDRAAINAGSAALAAAAGVAGFDLGGVGGIGGAGVLTVSGASSWTGGAVASTGGVDYLGDLAISGIDTKTLFLGGIVTLRGTTTWSGNTAAGNNVIRFWNGGTLNNAGTFVDANAFDSAIYHFAGGPHAFNNSGTYDKTAATTTLVYSGVAFNNTGTVNVQAGTFMSTGGTSSGTFNIGAGAVLEYRNGATTLNQATTAGAGTLVISSDNVGADATVTINGGTHTAALVFSGSTINGADHTFQAPATWSGGMFTGAARTTFANDVAISGAAGKTVQGGRIIDLHGTTTWSGSTGVDTNRIVFWNGGKVNNLGTFNDANEHSTYMEHSVGAGNVFTNAGTYNKLTPTLTSIDTGMAFDNPGTVNIMAGTLRPAGGTSSGTFNIAAGAALEFINGPNTLNQATTAGPGSLKIGSDGVGGDTTVTINGGTHTAPLAMSGSTLTGADHVFQAASTWSGGSIAGAASTTFAGDLAISGPGTKTLWLGRTVNLHGTTTWSGNTAANNNVIRFWNGGTLNNLGTFVDANTFASFVEHFTGGPHLFHNQGTYRKTQAATTLFDTFVTLRNTGTVEIQAGTLHSASGFTNEGRVEIAAGATLLGSAAVFVNTGTVAGDGTIATHAGGDFANAGHLQPGFSIGMLTVDGDLLHQAAGTFDVELASLARFDRIAVTDDVTLGGTLAVHNAGYVPVLGQSFVVLTFDQRLTAGQFTVTTTGFGAGVSFDAIYNPHDVTLVVASVPEPATWALWAGGIAAAAARRRWRRSGTATARACR